VHVNTNAGPYGNEWRAEMGDLGPGRCPLVFIHLSAYPPAARCVTPLSGHIESCTDALTPQEAPGTFSRDPEVDHVVRWPQLELYNVDDLLQPLLLPRTISETSEL
jgi:hypothetical protein